MAAEFAPGRAGWQLAGPAPGTLIGGYRLEEERIGAGGVADVLVGAHKAFLLGTPGHYGTAGGARLVATAPGGLLALGPGGRLLATTDPLSDDIDLRNASTGRNVATLVIPGAQAAPSTVVVSPDGHSLAVGCENGDTYVWHIAGGEL